MDKLAKGMSQAWHEGTECCKPHGTKAQGMAGKAKQWVKDTAEKIGDAMRSAGNKAKHAVK